MGGREGRRREKRSNGSKVGEGEGEGVVKNGGGEEGNE